ncbi:uncharacterized protein LOC131856676 [Cryptomeria japonica]|uniref:uncharacterized protein LOC131856676 n=1 Tax=Cryptomeria japonica TaxID=3369 RepID=UPI0027DA5F1F|nr:uncharacterized protein LOC131856676 [Cryptomeria japonica]
MEMEQGWNLKQNNSHHKNFKFVERKKVKWSPPPSRRKKLNFDGASRGNLGLSGFGAVVRDEKGSLVGAICGPASVATNNITDITTLEEGFKLVCSNRFMKVTIEGDSQIILNGIIKNSFTNWRLNAWIPRIKSLMDKLLDYQVHHIYPEGNKVANFLTNKGISESRLVVMSSAEAGFKDLQKILYINSKHIPRMGIG